MWTTCRKSTKKRNALFYLRKIKQSVSFLRLAEFAPQARIKFNPVFSGDMCVGENTSQLTSVEFFRDKRKNYARSGLHFSQKSGQATFLRPSQRYRSTTARI